MSEIGGMGNAKLRRRVSTYIGDIQEKRLRLQPSVPGSQSSSAALDAVGAAQSKKAPPNSSGSVCATANGVLRSTPPQSSLQEPRVPPPPPHPHPPPRRTGRLPQPRESENKPPPSAHNLKCICGQSEKLTSTDKGSYIVCRTCSCALHSQCVRNVFGKSPPLEYSCPLCRLVNVDEFHPTVGAGLLRHSYVSSSSTFSLSFVAQAQQWQKQQWAVHLRAVALNCAEVSGPTWPYSVQGKLNGRECVAIDPPKHLHVRREQCYDLTPLLRQGMNSLELQFTSAPHEAREDGISFCAGVVLTRPQSVSSIIWGIQNRSTATVHSGRRRVLGLLAQVGALENQEGDCIATGHFGRTLRPVCPISHCAIEQAAIGRSCNHVQVFDLQTYIAVNQRMRSLDKRWACPVCSIPLRPDDIVLEPFAQSIIDSLSDCLDTVEAVVFNQDCTWSTISALKVEAEPDWPHMDSGGTGDVQQSGKSIVELSDSD